MRPLPLHVAERLLSLAADGYTHTEISRHLGIPGQHVHDYASFYGQAVQRTRTANRQLAPLCAAIQDPWGRNAKRRLKGEARQLLREEALELLAQGVGAGSVHVRLGLPLAEVVQLSGLRPDTYTSPERDAAAAEARERYPGVQTWDADSLSRLSDGRYYG